MLISCAMPLDPWNVARLLQAVVQREHPQLVLMGKQAVDDDANQAGQFLAALLDWPQATFASRWFVRAMVCWLTAKLMLELNECG